MTKICVLSDSHDATGMLELCAQWIEAGECSRVIHLGDVRRDAQWLEERLRRPVAGVAGNCDLFGRDARELEFFLEGIKFLATHGDRYAVKSSYDRPFVPRGGARMPPRPVRAHAHPIFGIRGRRSFG